MKLRKPKLVHEEAKISKPSQKQNIVNNRKKEIKKKGFDNFNPQQIPIDEYYQLLNERVANVDSQVDKESFGVENNTKYNWNQVKDKFENNESDFWHQRNKNEQEKEEPKQTETKDPKKESMKNNFMAAPDENSLFNKFKKNNEKVHKIKNFPTKPPMGKRDKSQDITRDRSQELKRAKEAKKRLAEERKGFSYEEERKEAKNKKAKMDEIKNKYTKFSRSRSRRRSKSKGTKSCITKIGQNKASSEIQVRPSKAKNPRNKIIRDNNTEIVRGRIRPNKFRKHSPDCTTKCTRDDDLNIGQFLWDDLAYLNKEEAKLQQEILINHKNTVMQVKAVERKHNIDTGIVNTRQIVKQLNNLDPYETMKKYDYRNEDEDQIEESLENLNFLLAQNNKEQGERKKAFK